MLQGALGPLNYNTSPLKPPRSPSYKFLIQSKLLGSTQMNSQTYRFTAIHLCLYQLLPAIILFIYDAASWAHQLVSQYAQYQKTKLNHLKFSQSPNSWLVTPSIFIPVYRAVTKFGVNYIIESSIQFELFQISY